MMMKRWLAGAISGGLAAYFLDPDNGDDRRRRLLGVWRANQGNVREAGQIASRTAAQIEPFARKAAGRLTAGRWPVERRQVEVSDMMKVLVAGAIGGAVMYLLDPDKGKSRRRRAVSFFQEKSDAAVDAGREVSSNAADKLKQARNQAEEQVRHARKVVAKV
jgi:gas vesicle protein